MSSLKRKEKSQEEILDAVQRVTNGENMETVAQEIGVLYTTLREWCQSAEKQRRDMLNIMSGSVPLVTGELVGIPVQLSHNHTAPKVSRIDVTHKRVQSESNIYGNTVLPLTALNLKLLEDKINGGQELWEVSFELVSRWVESQQIQQAEVISISSDDDHSSGYAADLSATISSNVEFNQTNIHEAIVHGERLLTFLRLNDVEHITFLQVTDFILLLEDIKRSVQRTPH